MGRKVARPARLERTTFGFGGQHSIHLSYGRKEAGIIAAPAGAVQTGFPKRSSFSYNGKPILTNYPARIMADTHVTLSPTTPREVVLAVLGALIAPAIVFFLVYQLVLKDHAETHLGVLTQAQQSQLVEDNIKPFAELTVVDANAPRVLLTGEQVFNQVCSTCHAVGALGSPKFGDKAAWAPRIAKGYQTLIDHALHGFNKMPARGGDPALQDIEVERAIAYMADKAGANFKAPDPAPAAGAAPAAAAPAAK